MSIYTYFKPYEELDLEIRYKIEQIHNTKNRLLCVTPAGISDMPKGGSMKKDMGDILGEVEYLEDKLIMLKNQQKKLREEMEQEINKLSDPLHKIIIKLRFFDFYSDKEISSVINKSVPHTKKIKGRAFREFSNIILNDTL